MEKHLSEKTSSPVGTSTLSIVKEINILVCVAVENQHNRLQLKRTGEIKEMYLKSGVQKWWTNELR